MKRETFYHGLPGVKWGIWNCMKHCFQFGISEDTPMLARLACSRRSEMTPGSTASSHGSSRATKNHAGAFFKGAPANMPDRGCRRRVWRK